MNYEFLPIGSVVVLKGGNKKLMITTRIPTYQHNEIEYYVDYAACVYPIGVVNTKFVFFNHDDIEKVIFMGYVDDMEKLFQQKFKEEIPFSKTPKLTKDIIDNN